MSDSDDDITHVFDQTNGVLDGFEGEPDGASETAVSDAADRRGDSGTDADRALLPDAGTARAAAPRSDAGDPDGGAVAGGDEHTYAVDSGGTATDTDDRGATASAGDGAHVAASSGGAATAQQEQSTEPTAVQRSEVADPPAHDHDHDHEGHGHEGHEHHDHDGHEHHDHDGHDHAAVPVVDSDDRPSDGATGLGSLSADDSVAHVFDQTNGVVEGVEGESDGTAAGDEASAADRGGLNEPNPVGQQDAWHDDHYGADDGRDKNP